MDTRVVNLLCNIPGCLGDSDVQRSDKRTGAEITISRPKAIELYNSLLGTSSLYLLPVWNWPKEAELVPINMPLILELFVLTIMYFIQKYSIFLKLCINIHVYFVVL